MIKRDFNASSPSRRQFLKILGAAAAVPVAIAGFRMFGPQPTFHEWQGHALGGDASMSLWHSNEGHARRTLASMANEVARLEKVFSLYRDDSEITHLNRVGFLDAASRDFTIVLEKAHAIAAASDGAFDPTVQPLWRLYQDHFGQSNASPAGPSAQAIAAAQNLVGYEGIDIGRRRVRLAAPGMALTLNGIAQGYITDVVADILRNEGFDHVVLQLGETRVLGTHPEGRAWRVGVKGKNGGADQTIELVNEASATSGGYGTVFDPSGEHHHIFDPATGKSAHRLVDATVTAPYATEADALATALVVAGADRAATILATVPGARASVTYADGTIAHISA